jgi:hypothetical protein
MGTLNKCANCGCEDSFLTTPPPCPTAVACPTEVCSNIQYAECTVYTGDIITCGEDTVVPSDTNLSAAINNIVDYYCNVISNLPTVTVVAGDGVTVTSETTGTNTEYTISTTGVRKFVKEFTNVVFDNVTLTITGTELTACGLLTDACGDVNNRASDFTFNIMYLFEGVWIGLTNEPGVSVRANNTTGNISIILDIAPIDPGVTVRVTVIG